MDIPNTNIPWITITGTVEVCGHTGEQTDRPSCWNMQLIIQFLCIKIFFSRIWFPLYFILHYSSVKNVYNANSPKRTSPFVKFPKCHSWITNATYCIIVTWPRTSPMQTPSQAHSSNISVSALSHKHIEWTMLQKKNKKIVTELHELKIVCTISLLQPQYPYFSGNIRFPSSNAFITLLQLQCSCHGYQVTYWQ